MSDFRPRGIDRDATFRELLAIPSRWTFDFRRAITLRGVQRLLDALPPLIISQGFPKGFPRVFLFPSLLTNLHRALNSEILC